MWKATVARWILLLLIMGSSANCPSAIPQGRTCTLTISNASRRVFYRLHISWSNDQDWGPNLLQSPLQPGTSINRVVAPASYDVLVVDANQNQCLARGVRVVDDFTLSITEGHCR